MATHIAAVRGTDQTGGSSPNLPASSSLTLAVGDVVHVYVSFAQTGASGITATVADGLGNTYTQKFAEPHSSQTDWTIIGFECIVTNAGTATPTATTSTGVTYRTIHALQGRPGSGNTFAADASTSAESSSPSTTAQPGSAMTVVGPGYASAAAAYYSYGTMSSTWGTLVSATGSIDTAAAYKLISSSGSETPALVTTNGSTWVMGSIHTKEVAAGTTLVVDNATLTLSWQDVALLATGNLVLPVTNASVALQGSTQDFLFGTDWTEGVLTLTGQDVGLQAGLSLTLAVDSATLTVAGQDVPLLADFDYTIVVDNNTLTLLPQDVTFSLSGNTFLTVDQSTLTLSGQDVGITPSLSLPVGGSPRARRKRGFIRIINFGR